MGGRATWRNASKVSFYAIEGAQICPGDLCPFQLEKEDTPLKDEWKDKSVWDLIDEYDL